MYTFRSLDSLSRSVLISRVHQAIEKVIEGFQIVGTLGKRSDITVQDAIKRFTSPGSPRSVLLAMPILPQLQQDVIIRLDQLFLDSPEIPILLPEEMLSNTADASSDEER